ncbi:hypothetical protein GPECTOR_46g265 [Gonium pectorale]|uniref:PHD-type domain-containing protein n=1 Tax=Gonium pectorale TaxID=33097 RepID=A0A150G8K5_GONPE|nr:hypothetical protein GPECTOR_46g265 [Gonium pectorale]|eukprot:KXZ46196.1 hypothetical protein GPECTOR_46g265 [Gonium pectorale]
MCSDKKRKPQRLAKAGAAALHTQAISRPWYDANPDSPEFITVEHDAFKARLSRELQAGDRLTVHVQPPGKEVAGGLDHGPIDAVYELLGGQPGGGPVGRLNLQQVRNYMVSNKKYKAEVLENDVLEIWSSNKEDHFVMALTKEVCPRCKKETGDEANGVSYICDKCGKAEHAECAGLTKELGEDDQFVCSVCEPRKEPAVPGFKAGEAAAGGADKAAGKAAATAAKLEGVEEGYGSGGEEDEEEEQEEEGDEEDEEYEGEGKAKQAKSKGKRKAKGKEGKAKEVQQKPQKAKKAEGASAGGDAMSKKQKK